MRPFFDVARVVLATGSTLSPAQRLVALALADRLRIIDGRAQAWPGVEDLAARTGLCERSVRACLATLCGETGLFVRVRRTNRRGRASDLFVLRLLPATVAASGSGTSYRNQVPATCAEVPATAAEVPATIAAGSGNHCRALDEPPIEPPREPPREPESVSLAAMPEKTTNGNGHGASRGTDPATRVFAAWRVAFGKGGEPFTEERRLAVRSALRHFTEPVLVDAIRGAAMLPEETRGRDGERRDDITDLFRFGDKVARCSSWAMKRREDEAALAQQRAT